MSARTGLGLGLAIGLLAGGLAGRTEDITLTTYYPSPRGVYDELRANTLILADQETQKPYSLTMRGGRLLLTDQQRERAFVVLELPEDRR